MERVKEGIAVLIAWSTLAVAAAFLMRILQ